MSAEPIYQTLHLQARGSLRSEVKRWLRSSRATPRSRGRAAKGGHIDDMFLISDMPAEVEDRAVPGHWEGDLMQGIRGPFAIGTIVERKSRILLFFEPPNGGTAEEVTDALDRTVRVLPEAVKRSVTWDRGKEPADHKAFTIATGV